MAAVAISLLAGNKALAAPRTFTLKKKIKETSTICCYCSVGCGAIVSAYEDGTIKIEGNPDHPASRGGTDLFAQASVLTLYDPDRSSTITELGEIRAWSSFVAAIRGALSAQASSKGAGLRILTETINSPTLAAQIQQILTQPEKWVLLNADPSGEGKRSIAHALHLHPAVALQAS